jgi:inorganic pyrophosphatase
LDIVELCDVPLKIGDIVKIKVLGSFGLIDQGEIDWKVLGLVEEEAKRFNVNNNKRKFIK